MRSKRSAFPVGLVLAGALTALWLFFAPPQLGGSTNFTATVGNSMEPMFHKGDLAVTRRASSYRVGDVVLYESPVFHRPVLHRIIVVQNGHYYFKGDHNDFVDPGYVTRDELLGKLWFRASGAGKVLSWFGKPSHAALLAGLAALVFVLGGARRTQRRRRGRRRSAGARAPVRGVLPSGFHRPRKTPENIVGGIAALLALILLVVGFGSSTKRTIPVEGAYRHDGTFSYTARAIHDSSAYPSGVARVGEPLFLKDFKTLGTRFSYRFRSRLKHAVHGTIALKAVVSSDWNWHRELALGKPRAFSGDRASVRGTLDLQQVRALLAQVSADSGAVGAQYTIALEPVVRVRGRVGRERIAETFSPVLTGTISDTLFKLNLSAPPAPPGAAYAPPSVASMLSASLNPSQAGSVPGIAPNYVSIARYRFTVGALRGVGLGLAALALLVLLTKPRRKRDLWSQEKRIAFRYECVIVDVVTIDGGGAPTEIPDFESLATLARYCERPILRQSVDGIETYAVEDGGRLYLYRAVPRATPEPLAPIAAPPPPPPASRKKRSRRGLAGAVGALLVIGLAVTFATAFTAATTVPISYAGASTNALQLATLAPANCSSVGVTNLIVMAGASTSGTSAKDLIIGKNAAGTITLTGGSADDCIVGGGGAGTTNKFDGGAGTNDVCIGAPGATNTFKNCEQTY